MAVWIFSYIGIPSNISRHSSFRSSGPDLVTQFQRLEGGRKEINGNCTLEKPGQHHLHQVIRVKVTKDVSGIMYPWCDVTRRAFYLLGILAKNVKPQFIMWKTTDRPLLQDIWPVLLMTVKVTKKKKRLFNCHKPEKTEAIWQPNVMWLPGLASGTERGHWCKMGWNAKVLEFIQCTNISFLVVTNISCLSKSLTTGETGWWGMWKLSTT